MVRLGALFPVLALAAATFASLVAGGCSGKSNSDGLAGAENAATGDAGAVFGVIGDDDSGSSGSSSGVFVTTGNGTTQADCPASQGLSCYVKHVRER